MLTLTAYSGPAVGVIGCQRQRLLGELHRLFRAYLIRAQGELMTKRLSTKAVRPIFLDSAVQRRADESDILVREEVPSNATQGQREESDNLP